MNNSIIKDYSNEIFPMVIRMDYKVKKLKYEMTKEQLEYVVKKYNRAKHQVKMLFHLVNGDYEKLIRLEEKLTKLFYCPADKRTVNKILKS
jgi:hypothetical protein